VTLAKIVGPGGTLRTASFVKVVGPDSVLRVASFIKIVGPDGVLRTVYTAGGTVPAGANPTMITPASKDLAAYGNTRSYVFTASSSVGTPTVFQWGSLDGVGYVQSGGTTASATLLMNAAPGETTYGQFYCDMTIAGVVYRATCNFSFTNTHSPGGATL
jgi:hypothetical protein